MASYAGVGFGDERVQPRPFKPFHRWDRNFIPVILAGEVVTTVVYHSPLWLPIARFLVLDGRAMSRGTKRA